jgi:class 3 adenylate cyclase/tetratricopeptide (TPR) repeat protein
MSGPERSLATILFTDIVGSTERAAELRDAGWRDLREAHDRNVRQEIKRFGGHEINTAGDSFLATFERPARGIACAAAIHAAVRELGLEVRAGLHMGEVEGAGRDLGGLALHIGARVAARAGAGEILVSSTVHDALAGSAIDFEDRGVHSLKGVPGEWRLFAVTDVPEATSEALPSWWRGTVTPRRAFMAGAVTVALLLVGLFAARRETGTALTPEEALAAGAAPGIAVMPFRIADPNLALWEEGIVDLLTPNLDGAGGLRAISSQTVVAQWREGVPEGQVADLPTILEIARSAGGSYAVVGNAVTISRDIRLSADVYDLRTGRAIGAASAQGPPDSLYALADRLSLEILRVILEEDPEKLRAVPDLASVTTTSLPALKHFLAGEALLRKAQFDEAEAEFGRAVEADSSFALAWFGRVRAAEWLVGNYATLVSQLDRALALPDRLPPRARRKAEVYRAILIFSWYRARELAQELVRSYPDDPVAWYLLGWTYGRGPIPGDPAEVELANRRTIQLDPTYAPYRIGRLYEAFWDVRREDAAEELEVYARLAPQDHQLLEGVRLASTLAWGDSAAQGRAWKAVDTLDTTILQTAGTYLIHARFLPLGEALYREERSRLDGTGWAAGWLAGFLMWQGKIEETVRSLDHPLVDATIRREYAYALHSFRVATLPEPLERVLAFQSADTNDWLLEGAYAADRGRWSEHDAAVRALRAAGREAERDSIDARAFGGTADALEGYGLWRRGRTGEALPLLIAGQRDMVGYAYPNEEPPRLVCWWIGLLFLELGKPEEAIPYLPQAHTFASWNPYVAYDVARAYAAAGKNREAVERYRYALTAWRDADPVLRPRVDAARRELARLRATQ